MQRTYVFICALLLSSFAAFSALAQVVKADSVATAADSIRQQKPSVVQTKKKLPQKSPRITQYPSREAAAKALEEKIPLFAGVSVGYDLCGTVMALATSYGQYEGSVRVSLKNKYFPIVELGLGLSDYTHEDTHIHYKTSAPYARIGLDYNFLRNRRSGNRLLGGIRLAYTNYKFDLTAPGLTDPVYHTTRPFTYQGQNASLFWGELVGGLQTNIFKFLRLGWSVRLRIPLFEKSPAVGNAAYIPGFGKGSETLFGGTFNIIFDI
ncbi:DUF6048 family protein [Alloprevotella tannerae]|uniref:DUF6048 family protein n=1 Tax=Alloprevotella tannerae TaxID=76122 RepID=UPI0028EFF8AF|nr:DUF6048 family protein [Alloprevotella tannerae]